eukprot:5822286-Alexandrium_andersonii.AAC.1
MTIASTFPPANVFDELLYSIVVQTGNSTKHGNVNFIEVSLRVELVGRAFLSASKLKLLPNFATSC